MLPKRLIAFTLAGLLGAARLPARRR